MEKSNLLRSISIDADTLKEHIKRISKSTYVIHEMDKDLLLQKVRNLYDNISQLEISGQIESEEFVETPASEIEQIEKEPEPEIEIIEKKEEVYQEPAVPEEEPEKQTEDNEDVYFEEKDLEKEEQIVSQQDDIVVEEEQVIEEESSSLDLFSTSQETISDRFVDKDEKSLAQKLQNSQLSDLRSAIGINEKFLFINELFNGDMGRYNKILDELNTMQNKTGMDTYFMELKIEKQWNEEMEAFIKFKELIDRKFNE